MKTILLLSSLLSLSSAGDLCSQYATSKQGDFTLYNNAWGKDQASNGSQCTGLDSASGTSIAWHATWTWQGGQGSVKSFPNVGYQFEAQPLDSVQSIASKWEWRYDTICIPQIHRPVWWTWGWGRGA